MAETRAVQIDDRAEVEARRREEQRQERAKRQREKAALGGLWSRRDVMGRVAWSLFGIFSLTTILAAVRSAFPRVLFLPPSTFKAGFPRDFAIGEVSEKYKKTTGSDRARRGRLLRALGQVHASRVTPRWLTAENKFGAPATAAASTEVASTSRTALARSNGSRSPSPRTGSLRSTRAQSCSRRASGQGGVIRQGMRREAEAPMERLRRRASKGKSRELVDGDEGADHRVAGVEVDLPARLRRHAAKPHPDGARQRVASPAPSKVRRHATRMRFTWCMGGITFLMFLITVARRLPDVLLPSGDAVRLRRHEVPEFDMPFGMVMRNMHRWAAHGMVIAVWLHMFRVLDRLLLSPREFNWVVGGISSCSPCS
jgi:hypothetical protein